MKAPRPLKTLIPRELITAAKTFDDIVTGKRPQPPNWDQVPSDNYDVTAGIMALLNAQTIMIQVPTDDDRDLEPTPTLTLPFNPVCFQFIGDYFKDKPLTGMVITHHAAWQRPPDQPTAKPPGYAKGNPREYPETFLIWVWEKNWNVDISAYRTNGTPFIHPARKLKMTQADHDLYDSTWKMANLLCQYVNDRERVELQPKNHINEPMTRRSVRKGAPVAYYTCILRPKTIKPEPIQTTSPTAPTDRHVSICFDVRGHWREYKKSGKRVWIKAHQRGLGHEYVPKVYIIQETKP